MYIVALENNFFKGILNKICTTSFLNFTDQVGSPISKFGNSLHCIRCWFVFACLCVSAGIETPFDGASTSISVYLLKQMNYDSHGSLILCAHSTHMSFPYITLVTVQSMCIFNSCIYCVGDRLALPSA